MEQKFSSRGIKSLDLAGLDGREAIRKMQTTSAVNSGAGKATSDRKFPAARVDGHGGEPSAAASTLRRNMDRDPILAYYFGRNTRHWNT